MTMDLSLRCAEVMSFETATTTVRLRSGETPVTGATITVSSRLGGTFSAATELGAGDYQFSWEAPFVVGQAYALIEVRAKAAGYEDAAGRLVILVDPNSTNPLDPRQLFLLVGFPATGLRAGETVAFSIYVFTIEGFVVAGVTLDVSLRGPGSLGPAEPFGCAYRFTYTAPSDVSEPICVLISIIASKYGYAVGTSRLSSCVVVT